MNRRINVTKRQPKIRGIKRRLQALDYWANSFRGYFPVKCDDRYWNYKIPALDILVNRPTTTTKIQRRCTKALIEAAHHLLAARPTGSTPISIYCQGNCIDNLPKYVW